MPKIKKNKKKKFEEKMPEWINANSSIEFEESS